MPYYIVSEGRADCRGAKVGTEAEPLLFATRREARQYADEVVIPATPSKYYPLVVREVA